MKKTFIFFLMSMGILYAQNDNVGINTDEPTARLHVNGNMRVQTMEDIDYSVISKNGFAGQKRYKALYWDPKTKEIFTKVLDQPYVSSKILYKDNENAQIEATQIPLNSDDYFLFLTDVSVKNSSLRPSPQYLVGVKNVEGESAVMPVPGFELKVDPITKHYTFKAFYKHPKGGKLYYYDSKSNKVVDPELSDAPVWVGSMFAVSKKYMEPLYEVTVNYQTYWDDPVKGKYGGGKYGIELGKLIEDNKDNKDKTKTITKTLDAQETIEIK